jgi:hypothetical protein
MKRRASICYEQHYMDEALKEEAVDNATQGLKNVNINATSDSDSDGSPPTSPRVPLSRRNLRYS